MLEDRHDIELLEGPPDCIQGIQLRRDWEKIEIETTFSTIPKEHWHYYGQAFFIQEPLRNRRGELSAKQADLSTRLWRVGTIVMFPDSIEDVWNYLGSEPANIADYLQRKEK